MNIICLYSKVKITGFNGLKQCTAMSHKQIHSGRLNMNTFWSVITIGTLHYTTI